MIAIACAIDALPAEIRREIADAEQGSTTWSVWVGQMLRALIRHDHREGDGDPEHPWYVVAVNEYRDDRSRVQRVYERDFTAALVVARRLVAAQDKRIAKANR